MPNLARIVRFVILLPYYLEVYTVFDIWQSHLIESDDRKSIVKLQYSIL